MEKFIIDFYPDAETMVRDYNKRTGERLPIGSMTTAVNHVVNSGKLVSVKHRDGIARVSLDGPEVCIETR
ncbi:hypothetical protein [Lacticaseibacillus nasuensis]|uniref:Uncharacterized protein n=1 Tax=Lacticaseibacillus nasuensis JCM 17158 TaxID=1291734 RepID=A0A0R1JVK3_9LACO|nr:hypothetical protein [Lacticaseibacillus nasuensis]KRK70823.1 hypothetical protein FD02_GL000002 [Lacticaseibacillus nasuensis JCM 17158]